MSKRDKMVEIALSQKGYQEGPNNDTKYGDWYGLPNEPWCAMFVSWCANQVGVPEDIIPKFAGCTTGFYQMTDMGITTKEHIVPDKGDLIFFDWDCSGDYDHVGIVTEADDEVVYTIEGNHNDCVDEFVYPIKAEYIAGYAKPIYENAPEPEPKPVDEEVLKYQKAWNSVYAATYHPIKEDGEFGPETEWSTHKVFLTEGMNNHLVGWCQCRYKYHKGYGMGDSGVNHDGVDDDFGPITAEVTEQFKRDNHIEPVNSIIDYSVVSLLF